MKLFLSYLLSFSLFTVLFGQEMDSLIFESNDLRISKNLDENKYVVLNKSTGNRLDNVQFIKRIFQYYQVLDDNNQIFYLDEKGNSFKNINDVIGLCGTVPFFVLKIKETKDEWVVVEEISSFPKLPNFTKEKDKELGRFKKNYIDEVLFINGKNEFEFSSNFKIHPTATNPRMIILKRAGKYFLVNQPNIQYDSIDFSDFRNRVLVKTNNLLGILGGGVPKYIKLEPFEYYLAKAQKPSGEWVYIDFAGKEYWGK